MKEGMTAMEKIVGSERNTIVKGRQVAADSQKWMVGWGGSRVKPAISVHRISGDWPMDFVCAVNIHVFWVAESG